MKVKIIGRTIDRPVATIYTVIKNREKVVAAFAKGGVPASSQKLRRTNFPEVESALLEWFTLKRKESPSIAICDTLLQEKALEIAKALCVDADSFKASNGFLARFK